MIKMHSLKNFKSLWEVKSAYWWGHSGKMHLLADNLYERGRGVSELKKAVQIVQ